MPMPMQTQAVFVLSASQLPLMPCSPARARQLLTAGRAAVYRRYPFTIILKDRTCGETQALELKFDPGARTTGIALVGSFKRGQKVVWAAELAHRGKLIKSALDSRRAVRRNRRSRQTRYRPARFDNRRRVAGILPPSLMSRVYNILSWTDKVRRSAPIAGLSMEFVRFDTQKLDNPEISGAEYQQGTLLGYEVREYLLEKFSRKCVYCKAENTPLEIEHIIPRGRGGPNRISNLAIACHPCNQKKGAQTAAEFGYPEVQAQCKAPLKDAAAVNATRWRLYNELLRLGLPVAVGSGGRTKFNRARQNYPKAHWIDAACVGESGETVYLDPGWQVLGIKAIGHGNRQVVQNDADGFPRRRKRDGSPVSARRHKGHSNVRTGDVVQILVKRKRHEGRATVRADGSSYIQQSGQRLTFQAKHAKVIARNDGYQYQCDVQRQFEPEKSPNGEGGHGQG